MILKIVINEQKTVCLEYTILANHTVLISITLGIHFHPWIGLKPKNVAILY